MGPIHVPAGDAAAEPLTSKPPDDSEPRGRNEVDRSSRFGFKALENLELDLSEDEFSTSGVRKMILDQLYRLKQDNEELRSTLKQENKELRKTENLFHECDRDAAVLTERLNKVKARDIVLGAALASGSLIMGSQQHDIGVIFVAGALLFVGSVVARLVLK